MSFRDVLVFSFFVICFELTFGKDKSNNQKKIETFIQDEIKGVADVGHKCKSREIAYLLWLRKHKASDIALHCAYKSLKNSKIAEIEKRYLWTLIYEIYVTENKIDKSKVALKQAQVQERYGMKSDWYFLGPFPIGKSELDGNPIYSQGKEYLIEKRWSLKTVAYSELSPSGLVKWSKLKSEKNGFLSVSPNINWNELIMNLRSTAVTEWQGVLVNEFYITEDDLDIQAQCLGVNTFAIDDQVISGDVYYRDYFWYPLSLKAGIHILKVPLRVNGNTKVQCRLEVKKAKNLRIHHVNFAPDLVDGNLFSYYVSLVVTNMNTNRHVTIKSLQIVDHDLDFQLTARLMDKCTVFPGQVTGLPFTLNSNNEDIYSKCRQDSFRITLLVETNDGAKQKLDFDLRCRKSNQSFLFTFLDHDGSVQQAAVIKPLVHCLLVSCPVLLSLHGTGVTAQDQADSYKRKVQKEFIFGVEKLWLLAPTRHGAHNWEGPGERTAMTALKKLGELTSKTVWLSKPANPNVVIFAGHSMGGHGAWHVSLHHPDKTLAVISLAGWLSKEHYGDSNLFYHYDVSVSHTEPILKYIQESCIVENEADKHVSNLQGVPVMIRVGANDRTVHPYYSRKMYRLLQENHVNVTYHEIPGKEHWWWDTETVNDGGVTNDFQIRKFTSDVVEDYEHHILSGCSGDDECYDNTRKAKYFAKQGNRRNEGIFNFVLYNPASFEGGRGIAVLQQVVPFRKSWFRVDVAPTTVEISTNNIQCLTFYEPVIDPLNWCKKTIKLNGQVVSMKADLLRYPVCVIDGIWTLLSELDGRTSLTYGPARRIADQPFSIAICKKNTNPAENKVLDKAGVLLANLFYLTSNTHTKVVSVVNRTSLDGQNVILLTTDKCSLNINIDRKVIFDGEKAKMGHCEFHGKNLSTLYLSQHGRHNMLLVLSSLDAQSLREYVLKLAIPTIPPMTRMPFSNHVPDYVISSPEILHKGPGGFLCSGFWDNSWNYEARSSSCIC